MDYTLIIINHSTLFKNYLIPTPGQKRNYINKKKERKKSVNKKFIKEKKLYALHHKKR